MVHRLDVLTDAGAQQPADQRHGKLEAAEPDPHFHSLTAAEAGDGDAAGHRNGKGVQGQTDGDEENFDQNNHLQKS